MPNDFLAGFEVRFDDSCPRAAPCFLANVAARVHVDRNAQRSDDDDVAPDFNQTLLRERLVDLARARRTRRKSGWYSFA